MSIHKQIESYAYEVAMQINQAMEYDLKELTDKGYYQVDDLTLCFYRDEPLHYSIRFENKIIVDRYLSIEFKTDVHYKVYE